MGRCTVLPHVFVIQPKLIYFKTTECTLVQSLLVSVLIVDVDRQGFLVETYLVTVLTAYPSFYLTFIDRVFPFLLGLSAPVGCSSGRIFLFFPYSYPPACLLLETTRSNFVRPKLKSFSHATSEYCH